MQTQLGLPLTVAIFCRFLLKTGRRIVYPFAAMVSGALGVSLAAITMLLALNQIAALLSPLFGQLSDRWGYRTMMALGLVLASISMLAVGLLPHYAVLMFGLLAIGIGISICDPALHAYIGRNIPFAKRGQAMGLTELAWAASSLVGIPVAGWLVHSYSWNTPFVVMGVLGLGGTTLLRRLLPSDECSHTPKQPRMIPAIRALLQHPAARAMLFYAFLVSCASDIFFVTYALWMADSFSMGVVALGLATIAIGMAELSGELLTAMLADRLGLRRTMLITLLVTACCYALLPLWGFGVTGALVGIFLLCLAAEFNLVAAMSLCTEIQPSARATMMSWFQATSGAGHVVGVVTGGLLWWAGGITGVALVCATLCLLGFLTVRWGLSQWQCPPADAGDVCRADDPWPQRERRTSQTPVYLPTWYHQVRN
jgi:predicted MFS family arabinose efflux permease